MISYCYQKARNNTIHMLLWRNIQRFYKKSAEGFIDGATGKVGAYKSSANKKFEVIVRQA